MEALKTLLMIIAGYLLAFAGGAVALGWTLVVFMASIAGESLSFWQLAAGWGVGVVIIFLGLWLSMVARRRRNRYYRS